LEAIRFRMQQSGLKPRDLEPYLGSRSRVSEILSGDRPLSIDMIQALHRRLLEQMSAVAFHAISLERHG
jgi:HTH-type transcriptional regulator / antitoxin HigA